MEVVGLPGMSAMNCPGFTCIQEHGEHYGMVNFQLSGTADFPVLPDVFA